MLGNPNTTDRKSLSFEDKKQRLGMTALMMGLITLGCVPLYWGIQGAREARESGGWATAPGRIIKSKMRVNAVRTSSRRVDGYRRGGGISESYNADVEYEFVVDGVTHRGSRITVVAEEFGNREHTEILLEKYPMGREVTVTYKPGHPEQSVLEAGRWGGAVFFLLLAGLLILVPLAVLPVIWSRDNTETDPRHATGEQRQRFGLVFRERFLEWEPGRRIHLHRDQLGWPTVAVRSVVLGQVLGAFLGIPTSFWLFSGRDLILNAQFYLAVSLVLAVIVGTSSGLDGRRRDTVIDWSRQTVRVQVGWLAREVPFDDIQELALQIPETKRSNSNRSTSSSQSNRPSSPHTTYPARILLHICGKRYALLEVACLPDSVQKTHDRLKGVAEELATSLNVPLSESQTPSKTLERTRMASRS